MRRARGAGGGGGHDRISELPDAILARILSLMPAMAATQTTILSRRWRNLREYIWRFSTTLDFTAEFAARQTPGDFVRNVKDRLDFHRGKKIQRFLVSLDRDPRFFSDVDKWVEFAVARDVEELRLEFTSEGAETNFRGDFENWVSGFRVPHQMFDCMPLRALGLSNCRLCPSPNISRLCSLRSLSLTRVDVTSDVLQSILSECGLLERLFLRDCVHFNSIELTSPRIKLKQLVLVDCWKLCDVEISAPSLQSFHFFGEVMYDSSFTDVTGLADVFICSINRGSWMHDIYVKQLSDVPNVETLTVCTATLWVKPPSTSLLRTCCETSNLDTYTPDMPPRLPVALHHLRELQLLMDKMCTALVFIIFDFFELFATPLLERLFIRLPLNPDDSFPTDALFGQQSQPPDVHLNQLRVIKMYNFKGTRSEVKLVAFLLEKTPALESLVLVAPPKPSAGDGIIGDGLDGCSPGFKFIEEMDMRILRKQVLALPRVSCAVQIVACEYLEDDTKLRATHNEHTCEAMQNVQWMDLF